MEDPPSHRIIDQILYGVLSGVNWSSKQFKSSCPPREPWSWMKIFSWMYKSGKNKEELEKQVEIEEPPQNFEAGEERNTGITRDYRELSRCRYLDCDIKIQDPCAPCCCIIECIEPPGCTEIPRIDRSPQCGCARRKEIKIRPKCCDTTPFEVA